MGKRDAGAGGGSSKRPGTLLIPSRRFTAHVLLYVSWLIFTYMFLLTMFELIELLRPKRVEASAECHPRARILCPVCSHAHRAARATPPRDAI